MGTPLLSSVFGELISEQRTAASSRITLICLPSAFGNWSAVVRTAVERWRPLSGRGDERPAKSTWDERESAATVPNAKFSPML
jgi:DNA-binding transcriptional regulator PaaX